MYIRQRNGWIFGVILLLVLFVGETDRVFADATSDSAADSTRLAIDQDDVTWRELGDDSQDSMPLGNGDIGLNAWTEKNGDICFYISKTDAWSEDDRGSYGLMKLGRVRVSFQNNPFIGGAPITQILHLYQGEIEITGGSGPAQTSLHIWVDANHPVIHVESKCVSPNKMRVKFECWRKEQAGAISPDVIVPNLKDRVVCYHFNAKSSSPHTRDLIFGTQIQGAQLIRVDDTTLESAAPATTQSVSIYPLTAHPSTPDEWQKMLSDQIAQVALIPIEQARAAHNAWWAQFWNRSWIFASGTADARETTEGYVLQRFVTACAGRGNYPIKFNGSIFVTDNPQYVQTDKKTGVQTHPANADFRAWGGQYWFQNTRAMYWPRLMAGDFDMMLPLFHMYQHMLPENALLVKQYYGHDGAYFAETAPFYGGLNHLSNHGSGSYTANYYTPILELSMMMLDYYQYTGDKRFVEEVLLPVSLQGLTFFDQHFKRDGMGKLLLDPDNAIEMYWMVHDPAPDIAGLQAVTSRLLQLPADLLPANSREFVKKVQAEVPELPVGTKDGRKVLLPYTGPQTAKSHNSENPELYAVYPYRIYGLGKPDLQMARDTFDLRGVKATGCWVQDPVESAYLGDTDLARRDVHFNLTRKSKRLKFPAFWAPGHDYDPDEDNGGNGENGLQKMLMQTVGKQILLLPAWPKEWNVDFKLNAPNQTVVEGIVRDGSVEKLVVTPEARRADLVIAPGYKLAASAPDAR